MAGYLAGNVDKWIYIDIADQHKDSIRFINDCEKAISKKIQIVKSNEYGSVEDCVRAFGGLMTVPMTAVKMNRKGYGIELSTDYFRDGVGYLQEVERDKETPTLFDFIFEDL